MPSTPKMPEQKPTKLRKSLLWRWLRGVFWTGLIALLLVIGANLWIVEGTQSRIHSNPQESPYARFGIVLGTSRYLKDGERENLHFKRRMEAAAALFKAGRVSHFILTGDNSSSDYNEPKDMQNALVELGVPAAATTLDFAGFRTLDSIARAKDAGIKECVIITEDFHLPRALFLAAHYGIKATGFSAEPLPWKKSSTARSREWSARVLMLIDLYVLRTEPKFSGEKIALPP